MSGTAQTIVNLLASLPTNGKPGNIGPAQFQNIVATLKQRSSLYVVTQAEYGAIGDGSSHPLSGITLFQNQNTTGWTLVQWQAIFSFATALTNEIDWCAHQLAVNSCNAAQGGVVLTPSGVYRFDQTLTLPNTGQPINQTQTKSVSWAGDGKENTIIYWPVDLGTGHFGVTVTGRVGASSFSYGYLFDICFCGPNASVAIGAKPANMHGFGWASRREIQRLRLIGFNAGLVMPCGDQTRIQEVWTWNCFYGLYFDVTNSGQTGDFLFDRIVCQTSMMAAIGVSNAAEIVECLFHKCFFGTSPYGILKENSGTDTTIINESKFLCCQFEAFGNAAVSDGLAAGSHASAFSGVVEFDLCQFAPQTSPYNYATNPQTGIIACYGGGKVIVRNPTFPGTYVYTGFSSGWFELDFPEVIHFEGDLYNILAMLQTASLPVAKFVNPPLPASFTLLNRGWYQWEGHGLVANGNPTLIIGDIVANDASGTGSVGLSGGTTTEQVLGIVMLPHRASGGVVCVANQGWAHVVNARANVIANGAWARASSSGTALSSGTRFPSASANIGMWSNGSGSSPNLIGSVFLQGLV